MIGFYVLKINEGFNRALLFDRELDSKFMASLLPYTGCENVEMYFILIRPVCGNKYCQLFTF